MMVSEDIHHPMDKYLRPGRIPHIWCPGCGIGIIVHCYLLALERANIDPKKVSVLSGIGCAARASGYTNFDSFHTTHGRAIPFAIGLKLANPELNVTVFTGDGDLVAIGGNHFIHAARRNMDINVICVNNFNYGMTGGQSGPTTPLFAKTTTTPYGNYEHPFNLPYVAAASGAVYVARWTTLHPRQLTESLIEALTKKGFTFVEIISPCPTNYGRRNKIGGGLEEMEYYRKYCEIRNGEDPQNVDIELRGKIIVGKFVDIEKPTFRECMEEHYKRVLGI